MSSETMESLEQQLIALYEERESLNDRFGVSTTEDVIGMVECLEQQLCDFYNRFGSADGFDDAESAIVLSKIKDLSSTLDPMYSKKSVQFSFENDKPVLRAMWSEDLSEGENQ